MNAKAVAKECYCFKNANETPGLCQPARMSEGTAGTWPPLREQKILFEKVWTRGLT